MITEEIFYGVKCDRCGDIYEMNGEYTCYSDKGEILDAAFDDDWKEIHGRHYCPCCYTEKDGTTITNRCHDDDDDDDEREDDSREYIPRPSYPECYHKLQQFMQVIIGHKGSESCDDDWLYVWFTLPSNGVLSDLTRQMIDRILEKVEHKIEIIEPEKTEAFRSKKVQIGIRNKEFKCGDRVRVCQHQDYMDSYGKEGVVMALDDWGRRFCYVQFKDEEKLRTICLDHLELIER
jgi:hypothetical protein